MGWKLCLLCLLVSYWTLAQSSAGFTILGTEAISKEAMSDGDVDAVTKDTGYGRVLGEIIRDWGVACAKRRAECLLKLVSKTVPNLSTASGGGRLATDYNKFTRRCRVVAQSARRSAASFFGPRLQH